MRSGEGYVVSAFVLGFGFMRAWALTFLGDSGVTPPLSLQISSNMFYVFAPIMMLTMVLAMAVVSRQGDDAWVLSSRAVAVISGVLAAGTCLLVVNGYTMSVVAEAVCAVGFGCFLLQWGILSSRISVERLTLSLGLGFAVAALLCFVLGLLPSELANAFFVAFVPLSALAMRIGVPRDVRGGKAFGGASEASGLHGDGATATESKAADDEGGRRKRVGTLLRLGIAMFMMELVARSSLMLSGEYFTSVLSYPSYSFEVARLFGTVLASTLLLVLAKCSKEPLRTLYMFVPVLLVSSCFFLLFENWGIPFVTYTIAFSAGAWLETVFWIFFSHAHRRLGYPAIVVWGSGRIAFWSSTFVGLMFWSLQSHVFVGGIASNGSATTTLTLAMALLSLVVYLFVLSERTVKSFGIISIETAAVEPYRLVEQASADIAEEYGLSKRETEVCVLLAKGRDTAYIQEKLFISSGTVCSHRDRIYRKLGIHSKQELLDLVEERLLGPKS